MSACADLDESTLDRAVELLVAGPRVLLTGAGLSTDSGIPDYRGPDSPPRTPMNFQEFRRSAAGRQRYWARSFAGWPHMASTRPNGAHGAVAALENLGEFVGLITQNVDGLHEQAGSREVLDLHGRLDRVICLQCGELTGRSELQSRLAVLNPTATVGADLESAPDGDALVEHTDAFVVADCLTCGGHLKPDVVFFGETVPPERVQRATRMIDTAGVLLVAGSSLTVYSGLRFVRMAAKAGTPVVIVNRGRTRGDDLATVILDGGVGDVLPTLVARLTGTAAAPPLPPATTG